LEDSRISIREPVDAQLRRQLGQVFCTLIKDTPLIDVAEFTGAHPSRVSRLRAGRLSEFSIAWLLRVIAKLGYDFTLTISRRPRAVVTPSQPTATVVRN
jgi:predicted XRE-type DNA-binding protein